MTNKLLENFGEGKLQIAAKSIETIWDATDAKIKAGNVNDVALLASTFDAVYSALTGGLAVETGSAPAQTPKTNYDLTQNFLPWAGKSATAKPTSYITVDDKSMQYQWVASATESFLGGKFDRNVQESVINTAATLAELRINNQYIENASAKDFFGNFGKPDHNMSTLMTDVEYALVNPMFFVKDNFDKAFQPKQKV